MSEASRLEVLRSLKILDSGAEAAFDQIAELSQREFDMPMALVTFIDDTRQWCKASRGIPHANVERNRAFCHHTIQRQEVMVVPDATKDPRFMDNPLVTGPPGLRFYAGAPLTVQGERLGALCVLDTKPRAFSKRQEILLDELSSVVAALLKGRQAQLVLEQRNAELLAIADTLRRKNEAMEHFASLAAHDLRAPLRTIISFMGILEAEHASRLGDEGLQLVRFAQQGAKELAGLTESMLKFARTGSLEQKPVDLNEVVSSVQHQLQVQIAEFDATIQVAELPWVQGDRDGLMRVVLNLIANALQHRHSHRPPVIKLSGHVEDNTAHIVVADNGVGISSERRHQIFEPFSRGGASDGAGLGLFVCKRLLDASGGALRCEPSDVGAKFVFTLPVSTPS